MMERGTHPLSREPAEGGWQTVQDVTCECDVWLFISRNETSLQQAGPLSEVTGDGAFTWQSVSFLFVVPQCRCNFESSEVSCSM